MAHTKVAARLIDHHLERSPKKKVAFIVPTRPLVVQQSAYCHAHCHVGGAAPRIERIFGEAKSAWTQLEWNECVQNKDVLVGTAECFRKALVADKFLRVE